MSEMTFQHLPDKECILARREAEAEGPHPAFLIEKDIWIVATLSVLFEAPFGRHLVFKGGTSLSKVWHAIRRFSEDIDITCDIRGAPTEGTWRPGCRTSDSVPLRRTSPSGHDPRLPQADGRGQRRDLGATLPVAARHDGPLGRVPLGRPIPRPRGCPGIVPAHAVSDGQLLGVHEDELGVQRVQIRDLSLGGPGR